MPRERTVPRQDTEEEELAFWDEHEPEEFDEGPAHEIIMAIRPTKKKPVTIRLDVDLIEQLKRLGHEYKMPYQTLTRMLLKDSVRRLREAGRSAQESQ